jgi:predicted esterase
MSTEPLGFRHRFVPARAGASSPVLLLLHGTGGTEDDLLPLGHTLLPGAALLAPRGRVLENGMPRFFRRLAEGVFDLNDLKHRTHELADFVAAAAAEYGFDARRVFAAGYSNGANIAASTLLLRPGVLAGALLLRAMLPLDPETSPDLAGVPVFMAAGRLDPIVPAESVERLAALLRQAGAGVTLRWQNSGHGLEREEIAAAAEWLAQAATLRE